MPLGHVQTISNAATTPTACRFTERACQLTEWNDLRFLKAFAIIHCNSAEHLVARGEFQQAMEQYDKVIRVFPDDEVAVFNLAWLLRDMPRRASCGIPPERFSWPNPLGG